MDLHEMMATLPSPSLAQCGRFAKHICSAHSWYKHLPLTGGQLVVFLARDAGEGYPLLHPRLGPGPNTTDLYRERFGHLDYLWSSEPSGPFFRDISRDPPDLPAWFLDQFGMTFYPYASDDGTTVEIINSDVHRESMMRLKAGASHPEREALLLLAELYAKSQEIWRGLTDEEREAACNSDNVPMNDLPSMVGRFCALENSCDDIHQVLHARELAKIQGLPLRLRSWLTSQTSQNVMKSGV
jgi:hypothetical protein